MIPAMLKKKKLKEISQISLWLLGFPVFLVTLSIYIYF